MSWKVPQDWPTGPSPAPCDAWEGAEPTEAEAADAEAAAGDAYFAEEEIASWTGKQAVLWLLEAGNAFEALGLRPKPTPPARLRRRFLRLSLLTHPDKNNEPDAAAAFRKLSDSMRVVSTEQSQMDLLRGLFPRVYGVETTSADPAKVDGVYTTSRTETPEEAAVRRELEAQIERALREEKERRDASEADDEQAQRSKRRRSLEAILQAQKLQRLGRAAKAQVARGSGKGVKLAKAPQASASWRLPEHFRPPEEKDPKGGAAADPETLWRIGGVVALAANGWRRLESRRRPGRFYFLHDASGLSKAAAADGAPDCLTQELPDGWTRKASRSRPGVFYYVNVVTGEQSFKLPGEDKGASSKPPPSKGEQKGLGCVDAVHLSSMAP